MKNTDTRIVYKYCLEPGGATIIKGWFTKFLKVDKQEDNIVIWMENSLTRPDGTNRKECEKFEITLYAIGTGWTYPSDLTYIDTVQMDDGLVWHVFCEKEENNS